MKFIKKFKNRLHYGSKEEIAVNEAAGAVEQGDRLMREKNYRAAIAAYHRSLSSDGNYLIAVKNTGNAYMALGQPAQALQCYQSAIDLDPNYHPAQLNAGHAYLALQDAEKAISAYTNALQLDKECVDSITGIGNAYALRQNYQAAMTYYQRALELEPNSPVRQYNFGYSLVLNQKYAESIDVLQQAEEGLNQATADRNMVLEKLVNLQLGTAYRGINEISSAATHLQTASRIDPEDSNISALLGSCYIDMGDFQRGDEYFQLAIKYDPDNISYYVTRIKLLEQLSEISAAKDLQERVEQLAPQDNEVKLTRALLLFHDKSYQVCLDLLAELDPVEFPYQSQVFYYNLLGMVEDRLGDYSAAFSDFSLGNQVERQHLPSYIKPEEFMLLMNSYRETFTPSWVKSWSTPPDPIESAPVFLMGFPRSGTTLLGRILDCHRALEVLDERISLQHIIQDRFPDRREFPSGLARLSPADLNELRERYFAEASKHVEMKEGIMLVDKMPPNTIHIGFIYRLFPNAKILFAVRHPYDAVLSCFMQRFKMNNSNAYFLTLSGAADLYNQTMHLYSHYNRVLPLSLSQTHYESLVGGLREEAMKILEFLGLPWEDELLEYHRDAAGAQAILTPSYMDVKEPIYQRARYRWVNYADHLEPVKPLLQPWVEYFGYQGEHPASST